ncbi:uncharacterized protein LOC110894582 [Helianthus annuus]|uniref:uncharacterized protein LOC110894582 n=1 Tax=Helianthus annuus TaxID=4232 RepID=UPI000B8F7B01|nr:uncharacterized protein LOC110894582 [Helianthus annuus]
MSISSSTSEVSSSSVSTPFNQLPNITNFLSLKLDDNNFMNWKHQITVVLKTLGLLQFLSSSQTIPEPASDTREAWEKADGYVMALITATLSPSLMHLVRNARSASDLWRTIEETFFQQVFGKQSFYRTQFHNLKQENKSIIEYLNTAKEIVDVLNAIGDPISDQSLVLQVIQGLSPDFEHFVTSVENFDMKFSYAQLRSKLLTFEACLKQRQSSQTIPVAAMTAQTSNPPHLGNSQLNSTSIPCQICSKTGHRASHCYFRYSPSNQGQTQTGGRGNWRGGGNRGRFSGRSPGFRGGGGRGTWGSGGGRGFSANFADCYSGNPNFGRDNHSPDVNSGHDVNGSPVGFSNNYGLVPVVGHSHGAGILGPSPGYSGSFVHGFAPVASSQSGPTGQPSSHGPAGQNLGTTPLGFGPDHFASWAGPQTSFSGSHYGLHADLSSACQQVELWIPDSGASAHMTSSPSLVFGATPYTGTERVIVGDDSCGSEPPPHAC